MNRGDGLVFALPEVLPGANEIAPRPLQSDEVVVLALQKVLRLIVRYEQSWAGLHENQVSLSELLHAPY
jgi:hypothetical protein